MISQIMERWPLFDERLYVGRVDQSDLMAQFTDFSSPIMGAGAGFHRHHADGELGKELKQPSTAQFLTPEQRFPAKAGRYALFDPCP